MNFLSLLDYTTGELLHLLDRADALYDLWQHNRMPQSLADRQIGLWFFGAGFRNRLAFEIGARAMGGHVAYIPGDLGINEPLEDVGHYLENWFSMLVIRAAKHADLVALAVQVSIPVINARTEFSHPCEIMGDLQFIRRQRGSLDSLKVVFVGEVTNLCMSWFEAAAHLPIRVTQVAPAEDLAAPAIIASLNSGAVGAIDTNASLDDALADADLVYTDCWRRTTDPLEKQRIRDRCLPYQITAAHLSRLKPGALFLPCPPVTRGEEVSDDAMRSPLCQNYAAKNFLLHAQNAIMEHLGVNL